MSPSTDASSGPNLYDVLDVDPSAGTEEIREAWRSSIADLTPADRRFRLFSQAAEVLLDEERRAAYDAELTAADAGRTDAGTDAEPGVDDAAPAVTSAAGPSVVSRTITATSGAASSIGSVVTERWRRWRGSDSSRDTTAGARSLPGWPVLVVAALLVLSLGLSGYLLTQPSNASVEESASQARSAAERAIVPILTYSHESLEADKERAHDYLTDDYVSEYDRFFDGVLRENAERTEVTVEVELVDSAIVRATEERAEVLLFVNRPTTNAGTEEPVVYKDQVRVRLQKVGEEWLVDCLITSPDGRCRT